MVDTRDLVRHVLSRQLRRVLVVAVLGLGLLAGCSEDPGTRPQGSGSVERTEVHDRLVPSAERGSRQLDGPHAVVLGNVQDGGLPHTACSGPNCVAAVADPQRRRHVASLGIVLPASGRTFLIDATPDLTTQLRRLSRYRTSDRADASGRVDRAPVDGVLLTHAHIGHYLGLAFFGFETVSTKALPVYCTPALAGYLQENGPWELMVKRQNIVFEERAPGERYELGDGVFVTPIKVPHRDEYADTVGFRIEGPSQVILYVPDTDRWDTWQPGLEAALEGVDVALLDGTFYSLDELPGRSVSQIGHPLMTLTMDKLEPSVQDGRLKVYFTHLNHSNPANEPAGAVLATIRARGFDVAPEGHEFPL